MEIPEMLHYVSRFLFILKLRLIAKWSELIYEVYFVCPCLSVYFASNLQRQRGENSKELSDSSVA